MIYEGLKSTAHLWLLGILEGLDNDGDLTGLGYGGTREGAKDEWEDWLEDADCGITLGQFLGPEYPHLPGFWVWEGTALESVAADDGDGFTSILRGKWRRATHEEVMDWVRWSESQS